MYSWDNLYISALQFTCPVVSDTLQPHRSHRPYGTRTSQASLSIINAQLAQNHVHRVGDATQPSHPLLSPLLLPSIFPSITFFSNESVLCFRWSKYWNFSFNISAFNEYSGLISFRMDWLDLLAVHRALKSLLQHHSSKAWILQHSAFFIVQFSHPCMTTGKMTALTRWTFVWKQCLCFLICCLGWS